MDYSPLCKYLRIRFRTHSPLPHRVMASAYRGRPVATVEVSNVSVYEPLKGVFGNRCDALKSYVEAGPRTTRT